MEGVRPSQAFLPVLDRRDASSIKGLEGIKFS